jgi:L-fuconolactonase
VAVSASSFKLRIDSHHSFSERYSLAHLDTILKRNRFDGSVVVAQAFLPVLPFPDFVKGLVVMLDLRDLKLPYLLDKYQRVPRFKGVCHRFTAEIPEALSELDRRNIPLDAIGPPGLIPRIADRFPNLRIVIDHVGQPLDLPSHHSPPILDDQWAQDLAQAAQFPQVFCKLTAVARLSPAPRPCVQHALAVFGPRRLMFGSDWPEGLPDTTWKASLAAFTQAIGAQTVEVREELLGGTSERFYGL